ncbi:MAG: carbohydrate kinase family protein [Candidatus Bathyarchaeota archaeon]|nr:carbohydrate kinase family protein [Candidatus Bathyarchaeum sp.]
MREMRNYSVDCTIIGDVFCDLIIKKDFSTVSSVIGGVSYLPPIKLDFGGSGNVAVGLTRLGGNVQFIGKAGKDMLGMLYKKNLMTEGVYAQIIFDSVNPTGITLSFVDDNGERSFLVSRGANDFLTPTEVTSHKDTIKKSKYLLISGFSLVAPPQREAIMTAIDIAKANGVTIIFDPGSYNLIKQLNPIFKRVIDNCDIITPNWKEATTISGTENFEDVLSYFEQSFPLTALKMGKNGCAVITAGKRFVFPTDKVFCIDTTGAGDAFLSAFIYGLIKFFSLEATAKLANLFASFSVTNLGSRSFPSSEDITKIFETLNL